MQKLLKFKSLKYSFIIPVVLLLLIVLVSFSIYQLRQRRSNLENELETKLERTTETLASTSANPVWNFNYQALNDNLTSFFDDQEIITIKVKDNDGKIVGEKIRDNPGNNSIKATENIFYEGVGELGEVEVEFTDYYLNQELANIRYSLIMLTVFLCLLSIIVVIIISNIISKPLGKLTDLANQMANGNLDLTFPQLNTENELGKLASALSKMHINLKEMIDKLEHQAFYDYLTGIANRRNFIKELESDLEKDNFGAILLLDLDNFKEINDTLGHIYGDKLLKKVSNRLASLAGEEIFVARYGGDEFLLLLKASNKVEYINQQLSRIKEVFTVPFEIKGEKIDINYSIGIARYPNGKKDTFHLITKADTAMYRAKKVAKDYLYYDNQMIEDLKERKRIRNILKEAINKDRFKLKYQPQVNLKTGKADYVEALIRLKDYNISPGKFIPVAEANNLIIKIGRWVTKEAIRQLSFWKKRGLKLKTISINFSVSQLNDESYIEFLREKLKEADVLAKFIEIEITESILLEEKEQALKFLSELKKLGVKIALDDFGTGYSSLNYLTYIQLDKIKLDSTLSQRFLKKDNLDTIGSLIDLFHNLNLPIVAEGIEYKAEYQKLKARDCDYIQGYLFSRPLDVSEVEEIYNKNFIKAIES